MKSILRVLSNTHMSKWSMFSVIFSLLNSFYVIFRESMSR